MVIDSLSAYICLAVIPVLVDFHITPQGDGREVWIGVALISPEDIQLTMLTSPAAAKGEVFVGNRSHNGKGLK